MFAVLFLVFRGYQEIVDVRVNKIYTARNFVDKSLTRLYHVAKSEHGIYRIE